MHGPRRSLSVGSSSNPESVSTSDLLGSPNGSRFTNPSSLTTLSADDKALTLDNARVSASNIAHIFSSTMPIPTTTTINKSLVTIIRANDDDDKLPATTTTTVPDKSASDCLSSPTARPNLISHKPIEGIDVGGGGGAGGSESESARSTVEPGEVWSVSGMGAGTTRKLIPISSSSAAVPSSDATRACAAATSSCGAGSVRSITDSLDGFASWLQYSTPAEGTARSGSSLESNDLIYGGGVDGIFDTDATASSFAISASPRYGIIKGMASLAEGADDEVNGGGGGEV